MSRPSLKQQRSREILDAFLTCVAKYGLEGATQERIAEEAGVKRTLLRHYLGNRDQMVSALVDYVVNQFDLLTEALRTSLPVTNSINPLMNMLFTPNIGADTRLSVVFQALVNASDQNAETKKPLLESMKRFVSFIDSQLDRSFPKQSKRDRQAVAHGIVGIYLTYDALSPLDPPDTWRLASRRAVLLLIANLKEK